MISGPGPWLGNPLGNLGQNPLGNLGQGVAGNNVYPPPPQFEENVPEDELEFEGKLTRWNPYAQLALLAQRRKNHFGIECCQRMLML